jgi:uncharacterized lipoprotein YddW (UPF0748 family)
MTRWKTILSIFVLQIIVSNCAPVWEPPPAAETRAVWLHRFEYTRVSPQYDQDAIRQKIADMIDAAADANFNMILFQVRGNGDAYYQPGLEPWGQHLTGEPGKNPGWDPLAFAIQRAHKRGLELHAWLNTFPVWRGTDPPPLTTPPSPYLKHPEWLVCDSSGKPMPLSDHYVSFSPGIPEVHEYISAIVMDILRRYDVDGIHFDYIRYPEGAVSKGYSHDAISVKRFKDPKSNPLNLDWADWQREQLNHFISLIYNKINDFKPEVKLSAAVIGSYKRGGWTGYNAVYQDGRRWAELGKIDFLAPMIYTSRRHFSQPFTEIAIEWERQHIHDRHVYPGIGSFRFTGANRLLNWSESNWQIQELRENKIPGMVFFDASSLENHWQQIRRDFFSHPAKIPPMPWKMIAPVSTPSGLELTADEKGFTLSWERADSPHRIIIYLSPTTPPNAENGTNIWAILNGHSESFPFENVPYPGYISISAVNAAWEESPQSEAIRIDKTILKKLEAKKKKEKETNLLPL